MHVVTIPVCAATARISTVNISKNYVNAVIFERAYIMFWVACWLRLDILSNFTNDTRYRGALLNRKAKNIRLTDIAALVIDVKFVSLDYGIFNSSQGMVDHDMEGLG